MPAETTVYLKNPLIIGGQTINAITLRAPTLKEIAELGDPFEPVEQPDYSFVHTHYDVLRLLIERCVTWPADAAAWLNDISLDDTYQLIGAFCDRWSATKKAAAQMPGLPSNRNAKKE